MATSDKFSGIFLRGKLSGQDISQPIRKKISSASIQAASKKYQDVTRERTLLKKDEIKKNIIAALKYKSARERQKTYQYNWRLNPEEREEVEGLWGKQKTLHEQAKEEKIIKKFKRYHIAATRADRSREEMTRDNPTESRIAAALKAGRRYEGVKRNLENVDYTRIGVKGREYHITASRDATSKQREELSEDEFRGTNKSKALASQQKSVVRPITSASSGERRLAAGPSIDKAVPLAGGRLGTARGLTPGRLN
jgi:hypothetical protein